MSFFSGFFPSAQEEEAPTTWQNWCMLQQNFLLICFVIYGVHWGRPTEFLKEDERTRLVHVTTLAFSNMLQGKIKFSRRKRKLQVKVFGAKIQSFFLLLSMMNKFCYVRSKATCGGLSEWCVSSLVIIIKTKCKMSNTV